MNVLAKDMLKDWNKLPDEFVLKSNLMANASGVMVIRDKSKVDLKKLKKTLNMWLNPIYTLNNSWDCHFYCGTPKILAEKYMEDESGELRDYKFFCFDGNVPYFKIDYDRAKKHHANYYDASYHELDMSVPGETKDETVEIKLPANISEMMSLAQRLSRGFPFVRIDFFSCNGKLYLSEFTFAPGGGVIKYPKEFQMELGEMLRLSI